jgi:hypothetical protein
MRLKLQWNTGMTFAVLDDTPTTRSGPCPGHGNGYFHPATARDPGLGRAEGKARCGMFAVRIPRALFGLKGGQ